MRNSTSQHALAEMQCRAHLLCRAVGDVSAVPKAVNTDLLELRGWGVGVEALP